MPDYKVPPPITVKRDETGYHTVAVCTGCEATLTLSNAIPDFVQFGVALFDHLTAHEMYGDDPNFWDECYLFGFVIPDHLKLPA